MQLRNALFLATVGQILQETLVTATLLEGKRAGRPLKMRLCKFVQGCDNLSSIPQGTATFDQNIESHQLKYSIYSKFSDVCSIEDWKCVTITWENLPSEIGTKMVAVRHFNFDMKISLVFMSLRILMYLIYDASKSSKSF